MKGLARAGGGEAEMIAPGERIEAKVMRQLGRALAPALEDLRVDWGEAKVRQAPHQVPPVFDGERVVVYGFLEGKASGDVVLRAKAPTGELAFPARIETAEAPEGTLLATLAARALIRDLEEGASPLHTRRGSLQGRNTKDKVKEEIVRLGVTYGLVSRETSYVAVEERENPETGEMTLKKVPIALTRGWGGLETSAGVMACMAAPPSPDVMMSCDYSANLISPRSRDAASGALFDIPAFMRRSLDEAPDEDSDLALDEGAAVVREVARASALPSRKESSERTRYSARPLGSSTRALDRLVALQKADGSWDLDEELATVLGVPSRRSRRPSPECPATPLSSGAPAPRPSPSSGSSGAPPTRRMSGGSSRARPAPGSTLPAFCLQAEVPGTCSPPPSSGADPGPDIRGSQPGSAVGDEGATRRSIDEALRSANGWSGSLSSEWRHRTSTIQEAAFSTVLSSTPSACAIRRLLRPKRVGARLPGQFADKRGRCLDQGERQNDLGHGSDALRPCPPFRESRPAAGRPAAGRFSSREELRPRTIRRPYPIEAGACRKGLHDWR